jgi:hypothetical protein
VGLAIHVPGQAPDRTRSSKRLFDDWADRLPMRLVESRTLGNGVLSLTYEPADDPDREGGAAQ